MTPKNISKQTIWRPIMKELSKQVQDYVLEKYLITAGLSKNIPNQNISSSINKSIINNKKNMAQPWLENAVLKNFK